MVWKEWMQMTMYNLVTVGAVHTHTRILCLKNEMMLVACNGFFASLDFCTQNLIRYGWGLG